MTTGLITTVAGNGTYGSGGDGNAATAAMLAFPRAVAVDSSGNIYIADTDNECVRKVTLSSGLISTVAGSGGYGFSGDGNAATTATFEHPLGLAVDSSGNIYITDSGNERIRKVTVSTGKISTVAGNGSFGYGGDGGQATATSLDVPASVAVDSSGNIYIADEYNNRIRKVTTSGVISTVAGNGTEGYGWRWRRGNRGHAGSPGWRGN